MALPSQGRDIAQVVQSLAEQVRHIESAGRGEWRHVVSSGMRALDRLLPEGGLRRGSLVEWLGEGRGSGAATLALVAAERAAAEGGAVVVIDRRRRFYPPAAAHWGIDLARLIVVQPGTDEDQAWAFDQVLRTRGVAAVWGEPGPCDDHTLRRWQLAAESSGTLGLLVRDKQQALSEPSWAELRLVVEPLAQPEVSTRRRRLRVELARSRGGAAGRTVELEIPTHDETLPPEPQASQKLPTSMQHETRPMHLASELAPAKTGRRSRRA